VTAAESASSQFDRPKSAPLILHVVYSFSIGGLENGVVNLINRLPANEWRHGILSLTDIAPEFSARLQRKDTLLLALGKGPGHLWRWYPRLVSLFRQHRPAIVHTRNLAALEAVVPAWLAGVPARVHGEHGRETNDPDGTNQRLRWVRRVYSPFVSRYVALSRDLQRYLTEGVGVAPRRIEHLYNGVDTERFHPAAGGRTPIQGCPFNKSEHWLIGAVGRMDAVKDQVNLARAFVHALGQHRDASTRMRLVLVGDGATRAAVERVLVEGGASHLAWLAGERHDVPCILRGLDCFVLPSLAEGISNTLLEAQASGLPVIATRVGGNAEIMEEGVTGTLVPAADSASLAHAVVGYFTEPARAHTHGAAGRRLIERRFSLERMVADYQRLYTGLLSHGVDNAARGDIALRGGK